MLDKIEALRKRPKAVRDSYAFGIALTTTLLIALVWLVSLPSRLQLQPSIISQTDTEEGAGFTDELSNLRDIFNDSIEDIKAQAELIESVANENASSATASTSQTVDLAPKTSTSTSSSSTASSSRTAATSTVSL